MRALKWLGYKLGSRKFHVFVLASIFLAYDKISEIYWFLIGLIYISANLFKFFVDKKWPKKDEDKNECEDK